MRCALDCAIINHVHGLRLKEQWPALSGYIGLLGDTFPIAIHGDEGTGLAEEGAGER